MSANWIEGTTGRILSPHKSDRAAGYGARAVLVRDCPADSKNAKVELLEDFY